MSVTPDAGAGFDVGIRILLADEKMPQSTWVKNFPTILRRDPSLLYIMTGDGVSRVVKERGRRREGKIRDGVLMFQCRT